MASGWNSMSGTQQDRNEWDFWPAATTGVLMESSSFLTSRMLAASRACRIGWVRSNVMLTILPSRSLLATRYTPSAQSAALIRHSPTLVLSQSDLSSREVKADEAQVRPLWPRRPTPSLVVPLCSPPAHGRVSVCSRPLPRTSWVLTTSRPQPKKAPTLKWPSWNLQSKWKTS